MNTLELMDLIGDTRDSYVMAAQCCREGRRPRSRAKILLIAAVIAALLAGCAYAVMKLQNLQMDVPGEALENVISLQGYMGSPNYQAALEWYNSMSDDDTGDWGAYYPETPENYAEYGCTYQAQVDKVNAICEKYGLVPQGKWYGMYEDPYKEMFPALGIAGIHREIEGMETTFDANCYYYGSGSFLVYGTTKLPSLGEQYGASYFLNSTQKSAFSTAILNFSRDLEEMAQWEYRTQSGVGVLLVMTKDGGGLIVADLPDSFVTVSARGAYGMTAEVLEALADTFDFTFRVTPPDPPAQLLRAPEVPVSTTPPADRPAHTELEFWPEGMLVKEPVTLYQAEGYSLYIPDEGWEAVGDGSWKIGLSELEIAYYPDVTEETLRTAITPALLQKSDAGYWQMSESGPDGCLDARIYPAENGVYTLLARFPLEAAEGFGMRLDAIMNTFALTK